MFSADQFSCLTFKTVVGVFMLLQRYPTINSLKDLGRALPLQMGLGIWFEVFAKLTQEEGMLGPFLVTLFLTLFGIVAHILRLGLRKTTKAAHDLGIDEKATRHSAGLDSNHSNHGFHSFRSL